MKNLIVLITKDCLPLEALPCYDGCSYWRGKTPNIDELVKNGTIFKRHYTAGGSTAMSMSSMLTGRYPYEFKERKVYKKVKYAEFPSLFDILQKRDYECHIIWDITWRDWGIDYVGEFGDLSKIRYHGIDIDQPTDCHGIDTTIDRDDLLLEKSLKEIYNAFDSIKLDGKVFVWIHLPHIIKGRRSYIDDIDAFDTVVGYARYFFGDDNIYISTDHGHMNMHKHISGYGFHVYEPIVHIPLITPKIGNKDVVDQLTCNTDIPTILLDHKLPEKHDFVSSEIKYYAQPARKIAIITNRYKYIYNAADDHEEFYDLLWDPNENYNILERYYKDKDRGKIVFYDEHYFYPYKNEALQEYPKLLSYKKQVWRDNSLIEKIVIKLKIWLGPIKGLLVRIRSII